MLPGGVISQPILFIFNSRIHFRAFRAVSVYALAALSASAFALVDTSALEIYFNQSCGCRSPEVVD